jgi:hypothetical protein
MLPPVSRPRLLLALLLALPAIAVAGCGGEEESLHVIEGEPLELGELGYNVQITRFLNPGDTEDQSYLVGQEDPGTGKGYLGVFLTIENEGAEAVPVPSGFKVVDTQGTEYEPIPSTSPFALELTGEDALATEGGAAPEISDLEPPSVPADGELPIPDSVAAEGPIGGAMLLFLVDEAATENRPLELEIPGSDGETGRVELDI